MKKYIYIMCVFLSMSFVISAQTLDEARELYKIGEYEKALPIFEKEYKEKPTDAALNQWYGVCLFETGGSIREAEERISFASQKGIQDAFLYLGKIYTTTYRFDEAEKEFDRYAKLKRRDKAATERLDQEREVLSSLKKSCIHTENVQIIDSVVVSKNDFLSAYKLSPSSGELSFYDDFFGTSDNYVSTVYINEKKDKIYYAKPFGNYYSLYSKEKLLDDFGNEKRVSLNNFGFSGSINFPYIMADGVTIYFAAEDENGFGGYDLYITRYNMNNDTYLTPERLGMPFNSTFNDYMMVIDEEKGVGWFATDRFQPEGKVCVYTFIPNSVIELVQNDNVDENYLVNRARISSIKESWKAGQNYKPIIESARKTIEAKKEIKKDFDFVINDQYTYYTLNDFKNPAAKNLYEQVLNNKKSLLNIETRLQNLRDSFSKDKSGSNANEILGLENEQNSLVNQIKDLEIKARNQEINSLK